MAEKASITTGNAKLEVYKDGSFYRIDTLNFRPSEHPEFTKFLEQNFALERVHNNIRKVSGYYLADIDRAKRGELLNILSVGLGSTVDLKSPCIKTGAKS